MISRFKKSLYPVLGVVLVGLGWLWLSQIYPPAIIPRINDVYASLVSIIKADRFLLDLGSTMVRVGGSFIISLIIGVAFGIIAGIMPSFFETLHPVMVMAESAPPMAWLVIAILFFGMGHGPSLLVGLSAAIPIFFFHVALAMKGIDRGLIEMARSFGVPEHRIFLSIYFPGVLLSVVGASSSSMSIIWRVVIMAEAFTTAKGLGPQLWGSYLYSESNVVYSYILLIVLLGFGLEYLFIRPAAEYIKKKLRVDCSV